MKICALVSVFFIANTFESFAAPATTYDQRQDGALNVAVNVSNIQILAFLGDSLGDFGDYEYDYTDFTLKPITASSTTEKSETNSSSTSVEPWHTWPTISSASSVSTASTTVSSIAVEEHAGNNLPNSTTEKVIVDSNDPESEGSPESVDSNNDDESEENASSIIAELLSSAVAEGIPISINPSEEKKESETLPAETQVPDSTIETSKIKEKTGLKVVPADDVAIKKDPTEIADSSALIQPQTSSSSSLLEEENSPISEVTASENTDQASTDQADPPQPLRKCNPGYSRNQKGQCRRLHGRRRVPASLLPFGIRLSPKIHRHRDYQSGNVEN